MSFGFQRTVGLIDLRLVGPEMNVGRRHLRHLSTLSLTVLLNWPTVGLAEPPESEGMQRCARLLTLVEQDLEAPEGADPAARFEPAFAACEPVEETLPVETLARLVVARADEVRIRAKDYAAEVEIYEDGLETVTARGGLDHPARIALLEGSASALDVLRTRGQVSNSAAISQRIENLSLVLPSRNTVLYRERRGAAPARRATQGYLKVCRKERNAAGVDAAAFEYHRISGREYLEALRVRQAAFGETSPEAAAGWCWLSYVYRDEALGLAEESARRAVQIGEMTDDPRALRDALSCLRSVLEEQGKREEASRVLDRVIAVSQRIEEDGGNG